MLGTSYQEKKSWGGRNSCQYRFSMHLFAKLACRPLREGGSYPAAWVKIKSSSHQTRWLLSVELGCVCFPSSHAPKCLQTALIAISGKVGRLWFHYSEKWHIRFFNNHIFRQYQTVLLYYLQTNTDTPYPNTDTYIPKPTALKSWQNSDPFFKIHVE